MNEVRREPQDHIRSSSQESELPEEVSLAKWHPSAGQITRMATKIPKAIMTASIVSLQRAARSEGQNPSPVLTRQLLEKGSIDALVALDSPGLKIFTEADHIASLREVLAIRPRGDVWVFGYGSLIWNAAIDSVERRVAKIDGWHRSFCLSITALRATADRPGLMLALDRGGSCHGAAYRLAEDDVERELRLLWRREMVCGAYVPRWVELKSINGEAFGWAIAFTIDASDPQYAGDLDEDTVVHRLATASGGLGSSADYLFRTCDSLHANGIRDTKLERLAPLVKASHADDRLLAVA
jgi:glutathione-specific gamma-glutamylcyclotransferase